MPITKIATALALVALNASAEADLATELSAREIRTAPSTWQGHARHDFTLPDDGAKCTIIAPKEAAEGNPWIWRARFFGHQPALDIGLLKAGWHVCYCDVSNLYGSPKAVARWDQFHALATTELGLSSKPVLEGMSRGGLIIFNWASANPDKVRAIYGDNPVCNFLSWPGGKNGKRSDGDWKRCLAAYGIDEATAATARQPHDETTLKPIADAEIPVFLVLGEADEVVPVSENADPLAENYKKLGGPVKVWRKPGLGHHPHGLDPVEPILKAILATP